MLLVPLARAIGTGVEMQKCRRMTFLHTIMTFMGDSADMLRQIGFPAATQVHQLSSGSATALGSHTHPHR